MDAGAISNQQAFDEANAAIQDDVSEMRQEFADMLSDGDQDRIELMFDPWTWELMEVKLDGKAVLT